MDSFDVYAMVAELQELVDGRIKKIYQRDDEIVFQIQKNGRNDLFIKNGKWIFIEQRQREWGEPPTFAMTLRKHLSNGKILSIEQHEFDRIVTMDVMKKEIFHVIIELFSDGNVILADEKWNIIIPLLQQSWAHREIKPKKKYEFPPERQNPFNISLDSFFYIFRQSEKDVIRTLVMDVNISGQWGEEICKLAEVEKGKTARELEKKEIEKLYDSLQSILNKFRQKDFSPVIIKGKEMTVLPFPLSVYDGKIEKFSSFNDAIQAFFTRIKKEGEEIDKEKERLERQIQQQKEAIEKFKKEVKKKKDEGDAIYANYALCQEILEKAKRGELKEEGMVKKISWPFLIISLPYKEKIEEIKLDIRKSVSQNADEKYELSKKMKQKIKGAEKALAETFEKMKASPAKKERKERKKKERRFWFEKYRWFISSDGNVVIAGRDASSNEEVVKKYLKKGERYIHADIHGAPSCVVKAEDVDGNFVEISEKTLYEACQFALSYSKAWNQYSMGSAYWVKPEQVSKTPEAGEYLPKGAFVIRGKRNYVKCDIEAGIGKVMIKGEEKIMGGSPSAVKKWASKWVIVVPGKRKKDEVANELAKKFSVDIEKIQKALPPGNVNIKEEHL